MNKRNSRIFQISVETTSECTEIHSSPSTEDCQSQDKQANVLALKRLATLRDLLEEILPHKFSNEGQCSLLEYIQNTWFYSS